MQGAQGREDPQQVSQPLEGKNGIEAASTTQTVIALSSGESDFYAILCPARALDMKSMASVYGHEVKVALGTDLVSGRGMSQRLGSTRLHTTVKSAGSFSTGDKQRFGNWWEPATEQT